MKRTVLTLVFFISSFVYARDFHCGVFLTDSNGQEYLQNNTQKLLAYLGFLTSQGIVNLDKLRNLADEIKTQGRIITNPVPHQIVAHGISFTESGHQIHYKNFDQYLKNNDLDTEEVLQWLQQTLNESEQTKQKKEVVVVETKNIFTEMTFHPVKKGSFLWSEEETQVQLTHDIEVMSTPVTQWMWAKEMGRGQSYHSDRELEKSSLVIEMNGQSVQMRPDHYVYGVSWYSAAMFANKLSKKNNLPEVYDFSQVTFKPGTAAENGTLDIVSGKVKINGPSIYETEGYRLPTEAEQEFLLSDRGRSEVGHFLKNFIQKFGSRDHDQYPIAYIDGKPFYDLGWTWEFTNDFYPSRRAGGIDPVGPAKAEVGTGGDMRVIYGGIMTTIDGMGAMTRGKGKISRSLKGPGDSGAFATEISFRLVRTIK